MEGLRSLLAAKDGPRVVAMETHLREATEAVRELRPSILVIGKELGISEVLEFRCVIRAENLAAAAVVWGSPMSESEALRYLQAGASGVIRKTASLDDLWACLSAVSTGGNWMESQILRDPSRPV